MADNVVYPEEWRDIPGYEGLYQVSNEGRVRGLPRNYTGRAQRGRILKLAKSGRGQKRLWVRLCKDGVCTAYSVHQLVARSFLGERPEGHEINHKDCNAQNNAVSNLEYCTRAENLAHYHNSEHFLRGEKAPWAKLREEDVIRIFELFRQGFTKTAIAQIFGVNRRTVGDILNGKKWAHMTAAAMAVDGVAS